MKIKFIRSNVKSVIKVAIVLTALMSGISQAQALEETVGWVSGANASAITIKRSDKIVPYDEKIGILACDEIVLKDESAKVNIRLSNNERYTLDAKKRSLTIPCDKRGMAGELVAFLMAAANLSEMRNNTARSVSRGAISRGLSGDAITRNQFPPYPYMYSLVAEFAVISSGKRSLYLTWDGGKKPYTIEIKNNSNNLIVISQKNINTHNVTLPETDLQPGLYTLVLKDTVKNRIVETQLQVVSPEILPPMPEALKNASLSNFDKTIFYADYLVGFEDGRWTLEALQRVASIARENSAAKDWLRNWGNLNE